MKKYILLFLIIISFAAAGFVYKSTKSKHVPSQTTTIPMQPTQTDPVSVEPFKLPTNVNWLRMHYIYTAVTTENVGNFKKGVYKSEEWLDRTTNQYRSEAYDPNGTLRYAYVTLQTPGLTTYQFEVDQKTKKGKFILDNGHMGPENEIEKTSSAKEYFENWKKRIEKNPHSSEKVEETQVDGKNVYKVSTFLGDGTLRAVTFVDKKTYLTYKYMSTPGKKLTEIATYKYLTDDFSDEVFTLKPPKGYTLSD